MLINVRTRQSHKSNCHKGLIFYRTLTTGCYWFERISENFESFEPYPSPSPLLLLKYQNKLRNILPNSLADVQKSKIKHGLKVSSTLTHEMWINLFPVYLFINLLPLDTGRKLNIHKTFRRLPIRVLNVLCTFRLLPVSRG